MFKLFPPSDARRLIITGTEASVGRVTSIT